MNPFQRLISPRLPQAAVGLSGEAVSVVQLERRGGGLAVRSAGLLPLPGGLVRPGFAEQNVAEGAGGGGGWRAPALRGVRAGGGWERGARGSAPRAGPRPAPPHPEGGAPAGLAR